MVDKSKRVCEYFSHFSKFSEVFLDDLAVIDNSWDKLNSVANFKESSLDAIEVFLLKVCNSSFDILGNSFHILDAGVEILEFLVHHSEEETLHELGNINNCQLSWSHGWLLNGH